MLMHLHLWPTFRSLEHAKQGMARHRLKDCRNFIDSAFGILIVARPYGTDFNLTKRYAAAFLVASKKSGELSIDGPRKMEKLDRGVALKAALKNAKMICEKASRVCADNRQPIDHLSHVPGKAGHAKKWRTLVKLSAKGIGCD